jgi:hypothetical protein
LRFKWQSKNIIKNIQFTRFGPVFGSKAGNGYYVRPGQKKTGRLGGTNAFGNGREKNYLRCQKFAEIFVKLLSD